VIETDGLLIKNVDYNDAGTYTCRARVLETGSLEERDIKLEVIKNQFPFIFYVKSRRAFSNLMFPKYT